tara:strand:- start:296 stop:628 length:333 start_codon:yes stop_codon:yes gene_type:complete
MIIVKKSNHYVTLSGSSTYKAREILKSHGVWQPRKKRWRLTKGKMKKLMKRKTIDASEEELGRQLYYMFVQKDGCVVPSSTRKHVHYCVIKGNYCDCTGFHFRKTCKHIK